MSFLGALLYGYRYVQSVGATLAQRSYLNFTGSGVTVADNPATGATDVTIGVGATTETATTTNATPHGFTAVSVPANSQVVVEFYVISKKAATNTYSFFALRGTYYNNAGTATLITGTTLESDAGGTSWTATLVPSGATVVPTFTGQAATTIKSVAQVKYLPVTDT
jgi:hypothetical protein